MRGTSVGEALLHRHKNIAMMRLHTEMEPHVVKLIFSILCVGFAFGFGTGYAVRAIISYYRRVTAERSRNIVWHDSHIREVH
jgi:hypothetical protein